jgi:hypothetical protein
MAKCNIECAERAAQICLPNIISNSYVECDVKFSNCCIEFHKIFHLDSIKVAPVNIRWQKLREGRLGVYINGKLLVGFITCLLSDHSFERL